MPFSAKLRASLRADRGISWSPRVVAPEIAFETAGKVNPWTGLWPQPNESVGLLQYIKYHPL